MNIIFVLSLVLVVFLFTVHWAKEKEDKVGYHVLDLFARPQVDELLALVRAKKFDEAYAYITEDPKVRAEVFGILGPDYEFKKYMLAIEKSSVATCHRDENGQYFNQTMKYPSYTILVYLKELDGCLEVVERSHEQSVVFNFKSLKTIPCVPGQAILFDADMIHSGSSNAGSVNTTRVQLKLGHVDDQLPEYLQDLKKNLNASKDSSTMGALYRNVSCTVPIVSDLVKNGQNLPTSVVKAFTDVAYGKDKYNY